MSFQRGDIVVSIGTGKRVKVIGVSECGRWFSGICVGNQNMPDMPDRFKYYWDEWRVASFKKQD